MPVPSARTSFTVFNVIPVRIPSLRDRREDIGELLRFFFARSSSKHGRPDLTLSDDVVDRFLAYQWPGNIRELENVVERIVICTPSSEVAVADSPEFLQPEPVEAINLDLPPSGICMRGLEKEVLLRALQQCNWNQSMAARYLGLSRKTLAYRAHKHQLLKHAPLRTVGSQSNVVEMTEQERLQVTASNPVSIMPVADSRYRRLLEAAPDGIVEVDTSGRIILVNSQAEKMFGCDREELLGKSIEMLMPERFRGRHPAHRERYHAHSAARRLFNPASICVRCAPMEPNSPWISISAPSRRKPLAPWSVLFVI